MRAHSNEKKRLAEHQYMEHGVGPRGNRSCTPGSGQPAQDYCYAAPRACVQGPCTHLFSLGRYTGITRNSQGQSLAATCSTPAPAPAPAPACPPAAGVWAAPWLPDGPAPAPDPGPGPGPAAKRTPVPRPPDAPMAGVMGPGGAPPGMPAGPPGGLVVSAEGPEAVAPLGGWAAAAAPSAPGPGTLGGQYLQRMCTSGYQQLTVSYKKGA